MITEAQLLEHQLAHYADRLKQATATKEKAFLRAELYRLKHPIAQKKAHVIATNFSTVNTILCNTF